MPRWNSPVSRTSRNTRCPTCSSTAPPPTTSCAWPAPRSARRISSASGELRRGRLTPETREPPLCEKSAPSFLKTVPTPRLRKRGVFVREPCVLRVNESTHGKRALPVQFLQSLRITLQFQTTLHAGPATCPY